MVVDFRHGLPRVSDSRVPQLQMNNPGVESGDLVHENLELCH